MTPRSLTASSSSAVADRPLPRSLTVVQPELGLEDPVEVAVAERDELRRYVGGAGR